MADFTDAFSEGADEAEALYNASKQRPGRIQQLIMKAGMDPVYLRFLNDRARRGGRRGWLTVSTHNFIPTIPAPEDFKEKDKWPGSMWAVCQNDRMFQLRDPAGKPVPEEFEEHYGDCYIHRAYAEVMSSVTKKSFATPRRVTYALAVLREPVFDPAQPESTPASKRTIIGMQDQMEEVALPSGDKVQMPAIRIIAQAWSNFWAPVANSAVMEPRTILDKDFRVTRAAGSNDYVVSVLQQTPDHAPGKPSFDIYDEALKLLEFDLGKYLLDHASPEHYARFFIPADGSVTAQPVREGKDAAPAETAPAAAGPEAAASPAATPEAAAAVSEAAQAFAQRLQAARDGRVTADATTS